jgi:hypothetical protein
MKRDQIRYWYGLESGQQQHLRQLKQQEAPLDQIQKKFFQFTLVPLIVETWPIRCDAWDPCLVGRDSPVSLSALASY